MRALPVRQSALITISAMPWLTTALLLVRSICPVLSATSPTVKTGILLPGALLSSVRQVEYGVTLVVTGKLKKGVSPASGEDPGAPMLVQAARPVAAIIAVK